MNPYFTTVSGIQLDLVEPRVEDIDFKDAAHHLAHICRYGGACRRFYSVAEHLLRGLHYCEPYLRGYWLAHDAHEYAWQDDPTPRKRALPLVMEACLRDKFPLADLQKFRLAVETAHDEYELRGMRAVHLAAGLQWPVPPAIEQAVKRLDRAMLVTEWRALMPGDPPPGYEDAGMLDSFERQSARPSLEKLVVGFWGAATACFPALARGGS